MDGPTKQTSSVGEATEKENEVAEQEEESPAQEGRPAEEEAGADEEEASEETWLEVSARRIQALKRRWEQEKKDKVAAEAVAQRRWTGTASARQGVIEAQISNTRDNPVIINDDEDEKMTRLSLEGVTIFAPIFAPIFKLKGRAAVRNKDLIKAIENVFPGIDDEDKIVKLMEVRRKLLMKPRKKALAAKAAWHGRGDDGSDIVVTYA